MKTSLSLSAFVLILLLSSCNSIDYSKLDQPNILFFLVDDQRNDVLGCAGHPIVQTPTIDRLAANGIRFENAFATTSICAASRASIFTGLYESRHQYTFGKDPVSRAHMEESYPMLLKQAGYKTGFIGKFGIRIADQSQLIEEMFDYFEPSPQSTPHFIQQPDGSRKHSAEIKGDQAIGFIAEQSADHPFCLSVSFNAVHAVDGNLTPGNEGHYPYPMAVAHLYEDQVMPPPALSDPEIFQAHPDFFKESMHRERFHWRWDTEEKYQINMKAYLRMISGYDQVMERVIHSLDELGFKENTVIIYAADNGYYMGNRGFAGKWSHYEESLRIPFVIFDPRIPEPQRGRIAEQLVLNIDIPATIVDLAGIDRPMYAQGASILPVIENPRTSDWRSEFLIEHRMDNPKIPKFVGMRQERYVYANYYEQDPAYEYLHDLKKDPDQLTNLAGNPDYQDLLNNMRNSTQELEANSK